MKTIETKVHHAIIDLYEIHDANGVTASHICNYTGLTLGTVRRAMSSLEDQHILGYGEGGVVLRCENRGYFPLSSNQIR